MVSQAQSIDKIITIKSYRGRNICCKWYAGRATFTKGIDKGLLVSNENGAGLETFSSAKISAKSLKWQNQKPSEHVQINGKTIEQDMIAFSYQPKRPLCREEQSYCCGEY
jgi:hypothetical protein